MLKFRVKKIILILSLSFLCINSSFAWNNLKGIEDFKLNIEHQGDCEGIKFDQEVNTSIKYLIANSKINLVEKNKPGEYLTATILTVGSDLVCASYVKLSSYSFGYANNSAGKEDFYLLESFSGASILKASPSRHKQQVINWFEAETKSFVVEWMEAQK